MRYYHVVKLSPNSSIGQPLTRIPEDQLMVPYLTNTELWIETVLRAIDPELLQNAEDIQVVTCKKNRVVIFYANDTLNVFKVTKKGEGVLV